MSDYETFDASLDVAKRLVLTKARSGAGGFLVSDAVMFYGVIQNQHRLQGI